ALHRAAWAGLLPDIPDVCYSLLSRGTPSRFPLCHACALRRTVSPAGHDHHSYVGLRPLVSDDVACPSATDLPALVRVGCGNSAIGTARFTALAIPDRAAARQRH